jgi:sugar O-acyltransferase (sialic acid O-acetyltransferase NeuD family)
MLEPIWIYGAGGFGREVWALLQTLEAKYKIEGFLDDYSELVSIYNLPVNKSLGSNRNCIIAIADPETRRKIVKDILPKSVNIVSSDVQLNQVQLGTGNIICKGNILTIDIEIGDFVIINLACTIGHDVKIGNFVSIMPGVNISGNVVIEEGVLIGTGAVILPGVKIGAWSKIGAGAVFIGIDWLALGPILDAIKRALLVAKYSSVFR